jgi:hypothetical protein
MGVEQMNGLTPVTQPSLKADVFQLNSLKLLEGQAP